MVYLIYLLGKLSYVWKTNLLVCFTNKISTFTCFMKSCETFRNAGMLSIIIFRTFHYAWVCRDTVQHQFQCWDNSTYKYVPDRLWFSRIK